MAGLNWYGMVRDAQRGDLRILARTRDSSRDPIRVELMAGPFDGGTYDCPPVYPGPDGLPDALWLQGTFGTVIYARNGTSRTYDYQPKLANA